MLVRDLGEFRLIDKLAKSIADGNAASLERMPKDGPSLRLSIGDDAAAWDEPSGGRVLTTDTLVEGVHFDLSRAGWSDLGWKSMAVNLSDVAAMGCSPLYAVVTLGLRGDLPVDGLVDMYGGMADACRKYGGAIVGGDVVSSPVFFVTVALIGASVASEPDGGPSQTLLTRSAASPGDKIAVTGSLGCSAGGLRMLKEGLQLDTRTTAHLKDAYDRPVPRVSEGIALVQRGVATGMDVSDGLVDDMAKLCKASGVRAVVQSDLVPVDATLRHAFPSDWLEMALTGGDDYELLFTSPTDVMDRVAADLEVPVSVIGDVVEGPPEVRVLDRNGRDVPVRRGGWDHFAGT